MDDRDIEATKVLLLKDALIAEYGAASLRWQALQGASLGATGFGFVAAIEGTISWSAMVTIAGVSAGAIGLAAWALDRLDAEFEAHIARLVDRLARLKGRGSA